MVCLPSALGYGDGFPLVTFVLGQPLFVLPNGLWLRGGWLRDGEGDGGGSGLLCSCQSVCVVRFFFFVGFWCACSCLRREGGSWVVDHIYGVYIFSSARPATKDDRCSIVHMHYLPHFLSCPLASGRCVMFVVFADLAHVHAWQLRPLGFRIVVLPATQLLLRGEVRAQPPPHGLPVQRP